MAESEDLGYRDQDEPVAVDIRDGRLWVTLLDGRVIGTPLEWYPRLVEAAANQLAAVELSPAGIHWPEIDEDLSVAGLLLGNRSSVHQPEAASENKHNL